MTDVHTPEQRSYNMSRIRGKWTSPEKKIHGYLKSRKIKHMMHPSIEGNPDLILRDAGVAVFIEGCFWHGCPKCYREPTSNISFWKEKIKRNRERDRKKRAVLRKSGWKVVRIWEHEVKADPVKCADKIFSATE